MSLSKVSPFYSSAPSMFTDSQPKTGTDSVPFYIDFGSNPKRFGRFTVSQIFKNGQNYSEPTFQVFKKDNSGTFEKYQQLRIGDYEFKKFCFLKSNILNGELELSEHPTQFDKNPCREDVLQRCHKVRGQHRAQSTNICDFHSIRSGESSLRLCADSALLSQRKQ